jgi:hypothetical protein
MNDDGVDYVFIWLIKALVCLFVCLCPSFLLSIYLSTLGGQQLILVCDIIPHLYSSAFAHTICSSQCCVHHHTHYSRYAIDHSIVTLFLSSIHRYYHPYYIYLSLSHCTTFYLNVANLVRFPWLRCFKFSSFLLLYTHVFIHLLIYNCVCVCAY